MTQDLLTEIEEFLRRDDVDMTETAFGLAAMKDGKFIPNLREGRRVWPENQERVRKYMRNYPAASGEQDAPAQQQARAS